MINYKRMWDSLKKIVEEEIDIFGGEPEYVLSEKSECFKAQAEEADFILEEMKILEIREKLLDEKEKAEHR